MKKMRGFEIFLIGFLLVSVIVFMTCAAEFEGRKKSKPEAPDSLAAEGEGENIKLTWSDNSNNENGLRVYRREYGVETFAQIAELEKNATSYTDQDLGFDKDYEYRVTAFNDVGESEPSNIARAQTVPNAPTDLSVSGVKKYQATLEWTDNSNLETGYKVERQLGAKAWEEIADLPADTDEYTDTGLECDDKSYQYRVKAYNDAGDSGYSNTDDATTLACWSIYTLDSAGEVGWYTSIALDSDDKVHISYLDCGGNWPNCTVGDLKYATNASGSWQYFTLDSAGDVGLYTSIVLDSNDKVHISYLDWDNKDLKYATNASGSWQIFTLDSTGDVGRDTSIALDSNNKVHISYLDYTNYDLKYATNASGSWQKFTIDSALDVGRCTSLALDSNNKVYISYFDNTNGDLKYATNTSGSWQYFTLDSAVDVGWYTSIAIDSNNKVHISYADCGAIWPNCTVGDLKYATNASGSWQYFTLDSNEIVGYYIFIALDSNDKVHISYLDYTNADLKYATNAEVE